MFGLGRGYVQVLLDRMSIRRALMTGGALYGTFQ